MMFLQHVGGDREANFFSITSGTAAAATNDSYEGSTAPSHLCLQQACPDVESLGKEWVVVTQGPLENIDGSKVQGISFFALALRGRVPRVSDTRQRETPQPF